MASTTPFAITAVDAGEHVYEDSLDVFVAQHRLERLRHAFRRSAAADIKEVSWLAARQFAHVERSHRKARAVDDAADIAIEADIGKATVIGIAFARVVALVT